MLIEEHKHQARQWQLLTPHESIVLRPAFKTAVLKGYAVLAKFSPLGMPLARRARRCRSYRENRRRVCIAREVGDRRCQLIELGMVGELLGHP